MAPGSIFDEDVFSGIIKRLILILVAMNKQYVIALLMVTGMAFTSGFIFGRQGNHPLPSGESYPSQVKHVSQRISDHSAMTMDEMTMGLDGLSSDAFDKAFIEMMIVHHQGAVDMAELIPANARHEELKKLGREIIAAQTKEIETMKQWLKDWGYASQSDDTHNMDH